MKGAVGLLSLPALASALLAPCPPSAFTRTLTSLRLVTGIEGKPASSQDEDLKLTTQIILDHIKAGDIESEKANPKLEKKPKKKKKAPPPPTSDEIDVSKLDMRVGIIDKAWEHEEADKLFCEEIDIGEEDGARQIASGLRAHYEVGELPGQRVVVLANLKMRKLMGFPSHGMVICAGNEDGSKVEFVVPPRDAAVGERITFDGFEGEPASENQVIKKKMLNKIFPDLKTDKNGVATYKGVPFSTSAGPCVSQNRMADAEIS